MTETQNEKNLRQKLLHMAHDAIYAALTNGTPAPSIKQVFLRHTINEALRTCVDESKKFDTLAMQCNAEK
jgi:hypothetical protein